MRLAGDRNLDLATTAKTFLLITGRYWFAATYGQVGRGRVPPTPELLAGFSAVPGLPVGVLAALTGVAPPERLPAPHPAAAGVAELVRDVRRLTTDQLGQVAARARSLRS